MSDESKGASWWWRHRRRIAAVAGLVVSLVVCPQLPADWQGVCRTASAALRTFSFGGIPLDGGDAPMPAAVSPGDFASTWQGVPYP